jgi:hypothetical protein
MTKALSAIKAALEAEGIGFADYGGIIGVRLHPTKSKARASKAKGKQKENPRQTVTGASL